MEATAAELAALGSVKLAVKGAAVGACSWGDEAVSGAAGGRLCSLVLLVFTETTMQLGGGPWRVAAGLRGTHVVVDESWRPSVHSGLAQYRRLRGNTWDHV